MSQKNDAEYWEASAQYWRMRANGFELALREIVAARDLDRSELAAERWDIANKALDRAKHQKEV